MYNPFVGGEVIYADWHGLAFWERNDLQREGGI